jgi:hypothetical protein
MATKYTQAVQLEDSTGGKASGKADINDLDSDAWQGTVALRPDQTEWKPGSILVRLLDSDRREQTAHASVAVGATRNTITLTGLSAFSPDESN